MATIPVRIFPRRGTAAQWASSNPVLAGGEMGVTTDTSTMFIGDGLNPYLALPKFPANLSSGDFNMSGAWTFSGSVTFAAGSIGTSSLAAEAVTFPKLAPALLVTAAASVTAPAAEDKLASYAAVKALVAAAGLGDTSATIGAAQPITNCNSIVNGGLYFVLNSATNRPPVGAGQNAYLLHVNHAVEAKMQLAFREAFLASTMYIRQLTTEGWSNWFQVGVSDSATLATTSGANVFMEGTTIDWTEVEVTLAGIRWGTSNNVAVRFATFPGGVVNTGYNAGDLVVTGSTASTNEPTAEIAVLRRNATGNIVDGTLSFRRAPGTNIWSMDGHYSTRGVRQVAVRGAHFSLANPMSEILLQVMGAGEFNEGNVYFNWKT